MTAETGTAIRTVTEPRARFRDLLAAEWLKLWSLRSTRWGLLVSALVVIAFNAGLAYDHHRYWNEQRARADEFIADGIPLQFAFNTNAGVIMMIAAGALGALAITGEHGTGLIRTTFAAVPARRAVMAAKLSVIAAVLTGFGVVVAGVSFALTQAILDRTGTGVSIGHPGALQVVVASALLAPLCALVGAAIGALIRHGAGAVVGSVLVLELLPLFLSTERHWSAVLAHATPWHAWLRLVEVGYDPGSVTYPWTMTGAWTVFAVWAPAAAILALAAVHRRDV